VKTALPGSLPGAMLAPSGAPARLKVSVSPASASVAVMGTESNVPSGTSWFGIGPRTGATESNALSSRGSTRSRRTRERGGLLE